ncbi:MAG TPA: PhzF family phenazine biosynthesis protein [Opitutaceae bacterium]|nr:PhzF family phenazine biosynthesis protein [Opitutaceae bacterium]
MKLPLYWIDAFALGPFTGNSAAVVPLERWLPDETMQRIAFENGVAETAFFVPVAAGSAGAADAPRFHLRWFSPTIEVELCGHATLATAHVLFHERGARGDRIVFDSHSGPLGVARRPDGKVELDFPATPAAAETDPAIARAVAAALGRAPRWLGRTRFDLFAVLDDAGSVRALRPEAAAVAALGGRGIVVTARGDGSCDFVSRFFAPRTGIPEDPATGSVQCALMPYWAAQLGRTQLHARQLSARGGEFWCELVRVSPGAAEERVRIAGRTTLYLRGEIQF